MFCLFRLSQVFYQRHCMVLQNLLWRLPAVYTLPYCEICSSFLIDCIYISVCHHKGEFISCLIITTAGVHCIRTTSLPRPLGFCHLFSCLSLSVFFVSCSTPQSGLPSRICHTFLILLGTLDLWHNVLLDSNGLAILMTVWVFGRYWHSLW